MNTQDILDMVGIDPTPITTSPDDVIYTTPSGQFNATAAAPYLDALIEFNRVTEKQKQFINALLLREDGTGDWQENRTLSTPQMRWVTGLLANIGIDVYKDRMADHSFALDMIDQRTLQIALKNAQEKMVSDMRNHVLKQLKV